MVKKKYSAVEFWAHIPIDRPPDPSSIACSATKPTFAGTSCKTSRWASSRTGRRGHSSPIQHAEARSRPVGWDDDGQPGDNWDLLRRGTFVGVHHAQQAAGARQARPLRDYAESFPAVRSSACPFSFSRAEELTPAEISADTNGGSTSRVRGSLSIDHQRYTSISAGSSSR